MVCTAMPRCCAGRLAVAPVAVAAALGSLDWAAVAVELVLVLVLVLVVVLAVVMVSVAAAAAR